MNYGNPKAWSKEGYDISLKVVYPGFSDPITDEYREKSSKVIFERMNLGGIRLAQLISDIYKPNVI